MNKRWRWWLLAAVLVAAVAKAALPLLLVEQGLSMATGFVIRQAGKEALMSVGVAANDATWAATVAAWGVRIASMIGFGTAQDGTSDKYQVALRPDVVLPKENIPPGTEENPGLGSWDNPFPMNDAHVRVIFLGDAAHQSFCKIPAGTSVDGLTHVMDSGFTTQGASAMVSACNAFAAQWLQPGSVVGGEAWVSPHVRRCSDDPDGECFGWPGPIQATFANNSTGYWVERFFLCGGFYGCASYGPGNFGINLLEGQDGVKRVLVSSSGGFVADSTDPDWSTAEISTMGSPNQLQWKGTAPEGSPVTMVLNYDPNAGFVVQEATQAGTGVVYRSMTLNPSTSVVQSTVFERLTDTTPDAVINAAANPGTNGSGQTSSWPSDYARQGEAAAAANTIVTSLGQLHKDLTDTAPAPADPSYTKEYTDFGDTFSGLLGWQLPGHIAQCPTGSFTAFGQSFVLDTHCTLMQSNEAVIRASMMAAWALLALFTVLRA